jgi:hypothetical protein
MPYSKQSRESRMQPSSKALVDLETKFWQSLVDEDADAALNLLDDPALMVSEHGAMKFNHSDYKRMAEQGPIVVKSFKLSNIDVTFPKDDTAVLTYRVKQSLAQRGKSQEIKREMADSSVWARKNGKWLCVMHTETPVTDGKQ